jgi:Ca-activated chloride channel homolog
MCWTRQYGLRALLIGVGLHAQSPASRGRLANIQLHSDLVLINALVTDRRGSIITGLDASRFRLFEDRTEQVIQSCVVDDAPVSIGLVLDTSGSMSAKIPLLKEAAGQFVRAGNATDEYFIIEFRDRPRVVLPWTADADWVRHSIGQVKSAGSTALLDALRLAVSEIRHANNPRKALLLISDGLDNHSRYTEKETTKLISELDFPIYTINLYERPSGNLYAIQRQDPRILEAISTSTGDRSFRELSPKKLSSVAELIASEIRHEYVLGYVPSNRERDGKFRRVRIKVEPLAGQDFKISHRQGYYAPVQ